MNKSRPWLPPWKMHAVVLFLCFASLFATSRALPGQADKEKISNHAELRAKILSIARAYASHNWRATEKNVFHGKDPNGTQVDTPDTSFFKDGWHADGRENVGVPYQWGGFCTIEEFDSAVKKGMYAGHIHTSSGSRPSRFAIGVDCSGFISRCLDLPQKQNTRSLASLCYELQSYDELLPGDMLNKVDGHVVLFKEFANESRTKLRVYEAGNWRVLESLRNVRDMVKQGFLPMRYRPLDPRWVYLDFSKPSFKLKDLNKTGSWVPNGGKKKDTLPDLVHPLKQATEGEWARYDGKTQMRFPPERVITRGVACAVNGAHTDEEQASIQVTTLAGGKEMMTEKACHLNNPLIDMIICFASYDQDFDNVELVASTVEEGTYELEGRKFPARKITAQVKCSFSIHDSHYPAKFDIECYQSHQIPVEGMLRASYTIEVTWSKSRVSRAMRTFTLRDFFSKV